jgi:hypothetical protein
VRDALQQVLIGDPTDEEPHRAGAFYGEEWNVDTVPAWLAQLTGGAAAS